MTCPGLATGYGCMDPHRSARQMFHAYRLVARGEALHEKALDVLRYDRDMADDE